MSPRKPLYQPPKPSGPKPAIEQEYLLRKHFQEGMSLKEIFAGANKGKVCIYPDAQSKQNTLVGTLIETALQVSLEEYLLKPNGVMPEEIADLKVIKAPNGGNMKAPEIRAEYWSFSRMRAANNAFILMIGEPKSLSVH